MKCEEVFSSSSSSFSSSPSSEPMHHHNTACSAAVSGSMAPPRSPRRTMYASCSASASFRLFASSKATCGGSKQPSCRPRRLRHHLTTAWRGEVPRSIHCQWWLGLLQDTGPPSTITGGLRSPWGVVLSIWPHTCRASASDMFTVIRSCIRNERSWRSLRRFEAPRSAMGQPQETRCIWSAHCCCRPWTKRALEVVVVVVVVVVRTLLQHVCVCVCFSIPMHSCSLMMGATSL